MKIGCLGDIAFEVSTKTLQTIRDASWGGSASISTHQRHLSNALQEFVGDDPDSFTFNIRISAYLGSDPLKEINKIFDYERKGKVLQLIIGSKVYGKFRWLIKKHKVTMENFDKFGNLIGADISITLTEYTKG